MVNIKVFIQKKGIEEFIDNWRNVYCLVIPMIITAFYLFAFWKWDLRIWKSENFSDTLSSIITFVSIIISFFGVLLTMLISAKEKSKMIQDFLKTADKEVFTSSIKRLIMCGLLTVLIAACLFMEDIIAEKAIMVLAGTGVFFLIRFTALTYRFTNILLMLFISDDDIPKKREGAKLAPDKEQEMRDRINNGI